MLKIYKKKRKNKEAGGEAQLVACMKEALSSIPVPWRGWRRGCLYTQHLQVEVQRSEDPCHSWVQRLWGQPGLSETLPHKTRTKTSHKNIPGERWTKHLGCMSQESHERSQIGIGTNFIHIQRNGNLDVGTELHLLQAPYAHLPPEPSFQPLEIV